MAENLIIKGETDNDTTVAQMCFFVGQALSIWYQVEENVTYFYASLMGPEGGFSDGAIATFQSLHTLDQKITLAIKVMSQVLYQDEMESFRTSAKKRLIRIKTLNETRNKIAHGRIVWNEFGAYETPKFGPYFIRAAFMRADFMKAKKIATSVVSQPELWSLPELVERVESLSEGRTLSIDLMGDLREALSANADILRKAARLLLDPGIPYARILPARDQPA